MKMLIDFELIFNWEQGFLADFDKTVTIHKNYNTRYKWLLILKKNLAHPVAASPT